MKDFFASLRIILGWLQKLYAMVKKTPSEVEDEAENTVSNMSHDERVEYLKLGMRNDKDS